MKGANALGSHTCHLVCLIVGTLHSALRGKGQLSAEPHLLFLLSFLLWENRRSTSLILIHTYHLGGRIAREERCRSSRKVQGRLLGRRAEAGPEGADRVTLPSPFRCLHVCSQRDLSNCWVRCPKSHTGSWTFC